MTNESSAGVAVVTGASRKEGLGFEVARQLARRGFVVFLTARDAGAAEVNAATLRAEGHDVRAHALDVASEASASALVATLHHHFGRLDVLINNAGLAPDLQAPTLTADFDEVRQALEVNLFGPWRMIRMLEPLLRNSARPRIVNVSSEAASFNASGGMARRGAVMGGYAVSKAAQNAMTMKMAAALAGTPILVNAVCPGRIASHAGATEAGARPVAEGAAGVVWAATLPEGGPSGGLFRDGQELPW